MGGLLEGENGCDRGAACEGTKRCVGLEGGWCAFSAMVAVCGGALTAVRAMDGGDSLECKWNCFRGRCY